MKFNGKLEHYISLALYSRLLIVTGDDRKATGQLSSGLTNLHKCQTSKMELREENAPIPVGCLRLCLACSAKPTDTQRHCRLSGLHCHRLSVRWAHSLGRALLPKLGWGGPATTYCAPQWSIPPPPRLPTPAAHNGNPWFLFLF